MKKLQKLTFLVAMTLLGFTAINPLAAQSPTGNKNVTIQEYEVQPFNAIEVGGAFKVFLTQGNEPLVSVETDENLQNQITVRIKGSTLSIGSKGMSNPTKLNVYITFIDLNSLEVSGAANARTQTPIQSNDFVLDVSGAAKADIELVTSMLASDISGAANVILRGNADVHKADVSGAANLNALSFITKNTDITVSGAAKARITATENITSDVSGAGSLQYFDETGLRKMNEKGKVTVTLKGDFDLDSLKIVEVSENGDSTRVRIGNMEIEVYEGEDTNITIGSNKLHIDDSGNVKIKRDKKPKFNGHWAGFHLGVGGYLTEDHKIDLPAEYEYLELKYEKSTNVQLNFFEQDFNLIGQKLGIVTGLGVEWFNFRFDNNVKLDHTTPVLVGFHDESKPYTKSKLVVSYLNMPLILEYQTNPKNKINSFHIAAGVVGGVRIGSHTKMVVDNNKREVEKKHDDFHLSPLKADAMLRMGWGKINLYGTYSLTPLFRKDKASEFYPFSLGLTLLSF